MEKLNAITVEQMSGKEPFVNGSLKLDFTLLEFWSWSQSDLLNNVLRGVLAEFIVKQDLGIKAGPRMEWEAFDLKTDSGIRVEVKSAAYLQSWKQNKFSSIQFDIAPKKGWNAQINTYASDAYRQSDFYVFCVLSYQNKCTVNPLNMEHWNFYVLKTSLLDAEKGKQKSISLNSLLKLNPDIL